MHFALNNAIQKNVQCDKSRINKVMGGGGGSLLLKEQVSCF